MVSVEGVERETLNDSLDASLERIAEFNQAMQSAWSKSLIDAYERPSFLESLIDRPPQTRLQRIKSKINSRVYWSRMWLASKLAGFDVTDRGD